MGSLSFFIKNNLEAILATWEALFAAGTAAVPVPTGVRRDLLLSIADSMEQPPPGMAVATAEPQDECGDTGGFMAAGLFNELRALRTCVLECWRRSDALEAAGQSALLGQLILFNEAVDLAMARTMRCPAAGTRGAADLILAVLGHELQSPMAAIDMSAALISKAALSDSSRLKAASRIRRAVKEMRGPVDDLLAYARVRLGTGLALSPWPLDLGSLCAEVVEAAHLAHPRWDLQLHRSGDLDCDAADAPRLRHALHNLLEHALQHGDAKAPLAVFAHGDRDDLTVTFSFLGPSHPLSFEPHVQWHDDSGVNPVERPGRSVGLGLFVAREIALAHGGTLEAQSTPASGEVVFTLRLPRGAAR